MNKNFINTDRELSVVPSIYINDISLTEGNLTTKTGIFTVSLSQASNQRIQVQYATANDTALAVNDYTAKSGLLTFSPGQTSKTIAIAITSDRIYEPNETFTVNLSSPTNATIADNQGIATIINDDLPTISINDMSITEGNSGTKTIVFNVNVSHQSNQTIQVNYATANGTAVATSDYIRSNGTLTFNPGQTSKTIEIPIKGDTVIETDETFAVRLSSPINVRITDNQGIGTILNDDGVQQGFNYGEALQKSFLFYEAQRSGVLPYNNRIEWRGNSALNDGSDVGVDLTGGYYDAGDHMKFAFPMTAAMTMLSWGVVEYRDAYQTSGQLDEALSAIKWGTDWILKAHITENNRTKEFWGQVGVGSIDHSYWGSAENMTMPRPAFKITPTAAGSDLAAEAAAALASASIIFRPTNPTYADTLLLEAKQLYTFADTYRRKYSESITDAANYYNSWGGYNDELIWGATWLYKATGESAYLSKAENYYNQNYLYGLGNWTQTWGDKQYGSAILLAQITNKTIYRNHVESWLNYWSDSSGNGVTYTSGGLAWLDQWGSLRYSANTAFLAGIYSDKVNDYNNRYSNFAESQIDYILGDNPRDFSYMVGFGDNYPLRPHHSGAHGGTWDNVHSGEPNANILYGGLVGGPASANDYDYADNLLDYVRNEVALDYNAGLTGALARMYSEFGGNPLTDAQLDSLPGIVTVN